MGAKSFPCIHGMYNHILDARGKWIPMTFGRNPPWKNTLGLLNTYLQNDEHGNYFAGFHGNLQGQAASVYVEQEPSLEQIPTKTTLCQVPWVREA